MIYCFIYIYWQKGSMSQLTQLSDDNTKSKPSAITDLRSRTNNLAGYCCCCCCCCCCHPQQQIISIHHIYCDVTVVLTKYLLNIKFSLKALLVPYEFPTLACSCPDLNTMRHVPREFHFSCSWTEQLFMYLSGRRWSAVNTHPWPLAS